MAIATGTAILAGAAVAAGAGIYASKKSSSAQASAAEYAGDLGAQAAVRSAEIMAEAQKESARIQAEASDKATDELRNQFATTTAQLKPWVTAGENALRKYATMVDAGPGDFKTSPGYEFRLEEGARAIEQSGAARGKQLSGQTLMGLSDWGQNMASAEYDKFLTQYYQSLLPYQDISNTGLNAAARTGAAGSATASGIAGIETGTASNIAQGLLSSAANQGGVTMQGAQLAGNAAQNAATARASGYINAANAITSPINQLSSLYMLSQMLGKGSSGLQLSGSGTVGNLSQYLTM